MMLERRLPFLLLLLFVTACGQPGSQSGPGPLLREEQTVEGLAEVAAASRSLAAALQQDLGLQALRALPAPLPLGNLTLDHMSDPQGRASALPQGRWRFDPERERWRSEGAAPRLILDWQFRDRAGGEQHATLEVDWRGEEPTTAAQHGGALLEVPQRAEAQLFVDIGGQPTPAGRFTFAARWQESACGLLLEPSEAELEGYLGLGGQLGLDAGRWQLKDDAQGNAHLSSSGSLYAESALGEERVRLSWVLAASGAPRRDPLSCALLGFDAPSAGELSLALEMRQGEASRRLDLELSFGEPTPGAGLRVQAGLLRLDGAIALRLSGPLSDDDGAGISVAGLELRFADGRTSSLEALLLKLALRLR